MKCFRAFTLGMLLFVSTIYTTVSSPNGLESSSSEPCLTIKSCMDPISGSFFLSSTDLVVPGYEPIVIQRSYSSDAQEGREARFSLLSHAYLHFEIDPISKSGRPFLIIASEPAGGTLHYKNHVANKGKDSYQYFPKLGKATQGLTNIGHGVITSQNNISLNRIVYDPSISLYVLTIGDGTQRFYQKNNNGFAHLVKERKPNGNWVFYKYTVTYALSEIQTTNPSATKVYSTVRFEYENLNPYNSKTFAILTDTQKYLHYSYHLDEVKKGKDNKHFFRLNCIEHPTLPQEHFSYIEVKSKPSTFLIHQQRLQQKIVKEVDYYACTTTPLEHRIRSLSQPVGETDELVTTDTFHYNLGDYSEKRKKKPKHYLESDGTTEHRDVYDKKTIYRFDEHFVPSHIEKYGRPLNQENGSSDTLLYKESFAWYPSELTNRLRWQCTEANNKVLSLKMYNYDDNGNILEDILVGNLSGHDPNSIQLGLYMRSLLRESLANPRNETYVIKNTYYEGIPSLLHTKELPNGLRHVYTYLPGTNLVTACYTQQGDTLLARYFKLYNEDNVLIQEIQDNGTTQDINNLSGITERHVRCISVKNSQPALNFPEVVEEKYLDIASNTYRLLKKSIFSYNASCQVVEEAVYDANDNYAYSLKYSYDAKDRLISSQDALGRLSYFSYDDFNRVTEEKQASSPLIIRHEYDSLGRERFLRVADSTGDTSETKFHYDLKSRLIKTLDADHNTLEMSYDDLDHETKQILPTLLDENGTVQKPCIRKVNDIFGNILSETDARGFTTTSTYSAYHKPVHVTYPDGLYENFRYTREGLVDLHVSTSGTKTLYTYDCLGRILTKRVFPKERSARYEETFSYDAFHLLSQTDRSGTKTTYRYDGAGRKISTTTTRQGELLSKEGYDYDSLGRLYKTTSHSLDPQIPDQVHIQTFDLANRLIEERQEDSTGTCFSKTQYLYDTYDRKIATLRYLDTDSWAEERYTYDDKGRVTSYTDAEGNVTLTFYKDKLHNSQTDSYENEVITQDALGRRVIERYSSTKKLISTTSFNSDNAILSQEFFYYDVVGNKTKHLSRLFHEGSSLQEHVTVWEYDSHNRITTQIEAYQTPHEKTTRFTYTTDGQEKCVT
ncbi:MAG: RHS repeat protein, partial [Chlamydiae bacterium]|nr:RHS repeat protein [Chlamydiota bacterium]